MIIVKKFINKHYGGSSAGYKNIKAFKKIQNYI